MSKNNVILNKVPIVIKKNTSFTIKQNVFRDTVIYDSKEMNFFKEKYQRVTLFNRQNILNNSCRLIAKIGTVNGEILEKTSDEIVQMIGQDQFEVLFMALCSIINQEIRIRGLISILTINKVEKSVQNDVQVKKVDVWSQTDETRLAKINVNRKRRMRRHLAPYVVHDFKVPEKIKKVVIDVSNCSTSGSNSSNELKEMPDLGYLHDDNSSNTSISGISALLKPEFDSDVLTNPRMVIKTIDEHTKKQFDIDHENNMNFDGEIHETSMKNNNFDNGLTIESKQNNFNLMLPDNTSIMLPKKPEDHFHIATEENLKVLDVSSRIKLIEIQRVIDLKFCMTPVDDDGNLPIHMAVLNEDIQLLKRQCFMLNLKETSVDIEANGLTPLKLSLFKQSVSATSLLLTSGADPLLLDQTHSTYFHTAAELNTDHLTVLLQYCNNNVRSLISENEDLQLPGWEEKSDDELSSYLMDHICSICDSQGYTPLMLATNLGLYNNVRFLLTHSPTSVNTVNPTTGNTALYLAVVAACNVAAERGNKSKLVDHFRKTIETLLDYGADPTIDNYSGSNISVLLTDFQCAELSTLIANRGPASKYNNTGYNSLMFIKDDDVKKVKDLYNNNNNKTMQLKNFRKIKEKPVILESIVLNKSQSDPVMKTESVFNKSHTDSNKTFSNVIKIESDSIECHTDPAVSQADLTKSNADPTKTDSNLIKIESDSFEYHDNSNLSHADSTKTNMNSTKSEIAPKLIQLKKPTNTISESNEKSIKVLSNNIIVDKPDKIILTPIKLIDVEKSNDSIKRIDCSIEKIDSSINPINKVESAVIIESIRNIKANNSQNSKSKNSRYPNITFADFDPNTKSNILPSAIRFLYTPTINSIKRNRFLEPNAPVVRTKNDSIQNEKQSIACSNNRKSSQSLAVTKAKPIVYIKKSIPSTKKSIKKRIDSDNCEKTPLKTYKRKLSDSE